MDCDVRGEAGAVAERGADVGVGSSPPHVASNNGPNPKSKSHNPADRMGVIIVSGVHVSRWRRRSRKHRHSQAGARYAESDVRVGVALEPRLLPDVSGQARYKRWLIL